MVRVGLPECSEFLGQPVFLTACPKLQKPFYPVLGGKAAVIPAFFIKPDNCPGLRWFLSGGGIHFQLLFG